MKSIYQQSQLEEISAQKNNYISWPKKVIYWDNGICIYNYIYTTVYTKLYYSIILLYILIYNCIGNSIWLEGYNKKVSHNKRRVYSHPVPLGPPPPPPAVRLVAATDGPSMPVPTPSGERPAPQLGAFTTAMRQSLEHLEVCPAGGWEGERGP